MQFFHDYCYRADKNAKFCMRIPQDLLNNRGGPPQNNYVAIVNDNFKVAGYQN